MNRRAVVSRQFVLDLPKGRERYECVSVICLGNDASR